MQPDSNKYRIIETIMKSQYFDGLSANRVSNDLCNFVCGKFVNKQEKQT